MNFNNYSEKEIKEIIKEVLNELYKKDKILIKNETHEITISHKIACYLTNKFENWDVDCEYNRDLENPKECNYKLKQIYSSRYHNSQKKHKQKPFSY